MEGTLFKYRSLDDWKFLLDIFVNKRLYAAAYHDLNDPMEGRYYHFGNDVTRAYRKSVLNNKRQWRICSLSRDPANSLMWSYYAGGHTGVVLGASVGSQNSERKIRPVAYDNGVGVGHGYQHRSADQVALEILSQKQMGWDHEAEVRVFSRTPFVPIRLKSIRLGCRSSQEDEDLVRKIVRSTHKGVRIKRMTPGSFREPIDV